MWSLQLSVGRMGQADRERGAERAPSLVHPERVTMDLLDVVVRAEHPRRAATTCGTSSGRCSGRRDGSEAPRRPSRSDHVACPLLAL